jgi:hypothetical protein
MTDGGFGCAELDPTNTHAPAIRLSSHRDLGFLDRAGAAR